MDNYTDFQNALILAIINGSFIDTQSKTIEAYNNPTIASLTMKIQGEVGEIQYVD